MLLPILSVKMLFIKDPLVRDGWELGGKVLESSLSGELSCVTLGKSPNLSVLQSPSCKWE